MHISDIKDIPIKYNVLSKNGMLLMLMFHDKDLEHLPDELVELVNELKNDAIGSFMVKRIKAFKLEDKVSINLAVVLAYMYELNNPGKIMLLLIVLIDAYDKYNKRVNFDTVHMNVLPSGFYDSETSSKIITDYAKTNKLKNSFIY